MNPETTNPPQGANIERKVIRANQFILEDGNGKTRAVLDVGRDGVPGLYLYDHTGTPRAMLGVSAYGSMLALCDGTSKALVSLSVSRDGALVRLSDHNGKPRLKVEVGQDGIPGLELLYENGVRIWSKP